MHPRFDDGAEVRALAPVAWCSVATTVGSSGSQSIDAAEARANALLIAAAPDLLAALIRLLNIPHIDTESGDACDQARAAIAKTKGDVDGQRNGGK
jgi:hypothetical protein